MPRNPLNSINRKKNGIRHIRLNLIISLPLILLASLALTFVCLWIQPSAIKDVWALITESHFKILLLNWIPLLLIMLFLYALLNNTVAACALTGGAAVLFSIVNRNMIFMRQDPFKPMDISLGGEFLGIARSIDHKLLITAVICAVAFIVFFVLCLIFIRNKKIHPAAHLIAAVIIAAVTVSAFIVEYFTRAPGYAKSRDRQHEKTADEYSRHFSAGEFPGRSGNRLLNRGVLRGWRSIGRNVQLLRQAAMEFQKRAEIGVFVAGERAHYHALKGRVNVYSEL